MLCRQGEQLKNWHPTTSGREPPPAGGKPLSAGSSGAGGPPLPQARSMGWSVLNGVEKTCVGYFCICKMFKKRLTCFIQQICVKRQKEAFCQRNQMNNIADSEEGSF